MLLGYLSKKLVNTVRRYVVCVMHVSMSPSLFKVLPDKSLAFQKQLQQAHSSDLELEKMEVPNGEKNEKSEKSESLIRIFSFLIYIIYW